MKKVLEKLFVQVINRSALSPPCLPSTGDSAVVLHKMARRQSFDIDLLDVFAQSLNFWWIFIDRGRHFVLSAESPVSPVSGPISYLPDWCQAESWKAHNLIGAAPASAPSQHHSGPHQLNCSQQRRGFVLICFSCVLVLSQSEQISYRACHTCHTATAAVKIFGNGKMDDYSVAEPW